MITYCVISVIVGLTALTGSLVWCRHEPDFDFPSACLILVGCILGGALWPIVIPLAIIIAIYYFILKILGFNV